MKRAEFCTNRDFRISFSDRTRTTRDNNKTRARRSNKVHYCHFRNTYYYSSLNAFLNERTRSLTVSSARNYRYEKEKTSGGGGGLGSHRRI